MTRATLDRPGTTTAGAGMMKATVEDECGTSPELVVRRGETIRHEHADQSVRRASTIAGVSLLLMSVLSAVGYLVAVKGLVVPGNAARTAKNVGDHEDLFRTGVLSLYLVAALDVVVAWTLYRAFKPVSDTLSKLAAWLRVAYAAVFSVAISQLVGVFGLPSRALGHINSFTNIWDAGLLLFGLNLFVLAYLAYSSGYVPRFLGVLFAIAGFGYVFDTLVRALVRGSSSDVSAITGLAEFVCALWLVVRGRHIALGDSRSDDSTIGATR